VVVASRAVDVDVHVLSLMSVNAEKITDTQGDLSAAFDQVTLGNRIRFETADLSSSVVLSANGFINTEARADLFSSAAMTTLAVKNGEILLQAFGEASLGTEISVTRNAVITASASSNIPVALGRRIRFADSAVNSQFTQTTVLTANYKLTLNLQNQFALSANTSVLQIGMFVYTIPNESRQYVIDEETREYEIISETRLYNIRR